MLDYADKHVIIGEDRVWAGVKNFESVWTLIPEKMCRVSTRLALDLLPQFRKHDHGDGVRIVTGHAEFGPKVVQLGAEHGHRIVIL